MNVKFDPPPWRTVVFRMLIVTWGFILGWVARGIV